MVLHPYLNFDGNAEEAFRFYHAAFGGELILRKMSDMPNQDVPESEKNRVMHASIPISENQFLMASDIMPSMGQKLNGGNNHYICISPDSKAEADRLFNALSEGGEIEMPMEEQFWGDYFGSFRDKFGVYWMISYELNQQ